MMRKAQVRFAGAVLLPAVLLSFSPSARAAAPDGIEFFEKRIRPVLVQNCYECHSAKAEKAKGGLLLDSRPALLKGGDTGPALVPGDPEKSLLVKAVRHAGELQMPPKHKLDAQAIKDIEEWVRLGAPDPRGGLAVPALTGLSVAEGKQFWSFRPIRNAAPPPVKNSRWIQTPIDHFVLARLEARGLEPSPPADRRTLLRRATFDLTGLPPTPEQIEAFLGDRSPGAFARAVDRLLGSHAYGERWGRHWLDVVRYADTAGCNSDFPVPPAYKYRNWVIEAFNGDKPYDAFLREQIAGDLLAGPDVEDRSRKLIATGYLAISRRFSSNTNEFHLTIEDTIDNLGKAVLGLSLACARCHDHKYDPVPTEDYYALYGIFRSSTYTFPGVELYPTPRDYIALGAPERVEQWRQYEQTLSGLDVEYERLKGLTRGSRRATNDVEKIREQMAEINIRREDLKANPPPVELAYGVKEGHAADAPLMRKGEPDSPGDAVPRGFLQVLGGDKVPKDCAESGRRQLAAWVTDPGNPLTARVMANRLWQWHFGKGLVQTPNDFGVRGKAPTHPELLDYLASQFMVRGLSIKAMHRLIMNSAVYQQSSVADDHRSRGAGARWLTDQARGSKAETSDGESLLTPAPRLRRSAATRAGEVDPNNELLWRFDRRRLSAEEVRDALLFVSGGLDRSIGGPHPFPPRKEWRFTQHHPFVDVYPTSQRSVYVMQQRIRKHPFFETWDGADPNAPTGVRPVSTTPIQALFMMNDPLVHEQSAALGRRVQAACDTTAVRIGRAYLLAYGRPPSRDEILSGEEYLREICAALKESGTPEDKLADAAWASYSRVLLSANEFLFVD